VKAVEPSVRDFSKNKRIVWLELDEQHMGIHSFALAVLSHALFPAAQIEDQSLAKARVNQTLSELSDAVPIVTEFFTASVFGYLASYNVDRKTRGEVSDGP
jgi:hypothetical protein